MISVLIPVLNYNLTDLVATLHKMLSKENIEFEIICFEDGSKEENVSKNKEIEKLPYTKLIVSRKNIGRIKARKLLCQKAKFSWLLFLDADINLKGHDFISNYLKYTNANYDAIYGGFAYSREKPKTTQLLRWKYGIKHEEVPAKIRNQKPYKVIISANCLIKKEVFEYLDLNEDQKVYGLDSFIGSKLKEKSVKVLHIDNEVLHLGLEENSVFLNKKEQASDIILKLHKEGVLNNPQNSLLRLFILLKKSRTNSLFSWAYKTFESRMKNNLTGSNPNIPLLQFYRISYMCYKDSLIKTK